MVSNQFLELLDQYKNEPIYLIGLPGNSGDELLQKGLEFYLRDHNFWLVSDAETAAVILIQGGGNIDDVWNVGISLLKKFIQNHPNKEIIVAPSTYHFLHFDFAKLLKTATQTIYLFAREKRSLNRLLSLDLPNNIHLDAADDTAFLLVGTAYLQQLKRQCYEGHVLFAWRTDRESNIVFLESRLGSNNPWQWLVKIYQQWIFKRFLDKEAPAFCNQLNKKTADVSLAGYESFITEISGASVIYTDRLHVGILGAMLGKTVHLYKTRYDKVEGVYEQTLCRYPNVISHF